MNRAERRALEREAQRRREAVALLRLAESVCGYAAGVVGNGVAPEEARAAAVDAAGELSEVAAALRRLTRLRGPERREAARELDRAGVPRVEIAVRLGVSPSSVWQYLHRATLRPGRLHVVRAGPRGRPIVGRVHRTAVSVFPPRMTVTTVPAACLDARTVKPLSLSHGPRSLTGMLAHRWA